MAEDVLGYLQSKGLQIKQAGPNEVHVPCFYCQEDPQKRGRLYINIDPSQEVPGLHMCLAGETEVITWDGVAPIAELAGGVHRLMTQAGRWVDAPVRSFGVQKLRKVTLTRNGRSKEIFATPEHRWFVRSGKNRANLTELVTDGLKPGHRLAWAYGQGCSSVRPSAFGVAAGIVYGDGTVQSNGKGSVVCLYDAELLAWFSNSPVVERANENDTPFWYVSDLPTGFKKRPDLNESKSFLYGWLSGYFAADGDINKEGQATLWSASLDDLKFVENLCHRIGVRVFEPRGPYHGSNRFGDNPMYGLTFMTSSLSKDFFVLSKHAERFREKSYERKGWVVRSVEETDRIEEVFCATVDGYGSFVLAGNILTGNCHLCGERGGLNKIKKHFGDSISSSDGDDKSYESAEESRQRHAILKAATEYYHANLSTREDVLQWLEAERGLDIETILKHEIGWADGSLTKFLTGKNFTVENIHKTGLCDARGRDFLFAHVVIPYHVHGNTVMLRGKDMGGKYLTPPGQKARLFNTDATWQAEELIVCEGEFDAMVLEQLGYNAIGVPGANTWQDNWTGYTADARKVYVCMDNDAAGQAGAEKIARVIGPKARIVHMPEHETGRPKNDPTEWIVNQNHTKGDFDLLLMRAKGGHLVTVDDAFVEWEEMHDVTGIKFGLEKLDTLIAPGLLPSQVMLVLAKTGSGKTIMTLNLFHRMLLLNPHLQILFVSLEQTRSEWFERARRIHRFYDLHADEKATLDFYRPSLMLMDKNRITEEELVGCIEQFQFERGQVPDLIAVDYLGYWARSYKGEAYERTSQAIMAMKAIAKEHRTAFFAPHQVSRMADFGEEPDLGASRDSGVVEETGDFVAAIWSPDQRRGRNAEERTGEINFKLLKSRHGGVGTKIQLQFAPLSLAMVPYEDAELLERARSEREMALRGDTFEQAIRRHVTGQRDVAPGWDRR